MCNVMCPRSLLLFLSVVVLLLLSATTTTAETSVDHTALTDSHVASDVQSLDDDYCFVSFGCWGGYNKRTQAAVAKGMDKAITRDMKRKPSFVIAAGDNFYKSGVKSVNDTRFQETFEKVYHQNSFQVPWYVALGNHDYRGNFLAQANYTSRSERWNMPFAYFSKLLAGGSILLVVIDTPLLERCENNGNTHQRCWDGGKQKEWIRKTFAEHQDDSKIRFRIVVGHYPLFANGPHINFPYLINFLTPLFHKHCVQMYINADNHYIQLSIRNGVSYVNSGGGAGIGQKHTHKDRGYRKNPHSVFEKISDGFFTHCVKTIDDGSKRKTIMINRAFNEKGDEQHKWEFEAADGVCVAPKGGDGSNGEGLIVAAGGDADAMTPDSGDIVVEESAKQHSSTPKKNPEQSGIRHSTPAGVPQESSLVVAGNNLVVDGSFYGVVLIGISALFFFIYRCCASHRTHPHQRHLHAK